MAETIEKRVYDLEERLINFAVMILNLTEKLPNDAGAKHLGGQLNRSGTSPALNYGEAQGGESDADFLHKIKVCLKELRESQVTLKIIHRKPYLQENIVNPVLKECGELVAIFTTIAKSTKSRIENLGKPPENK